MSKDSLFLFVSLSAAVGMHPFCPKEKQGRANRQQKTTLPSPETPAALLATLFPIEPLCTALRSPFQRCFSHTYPPLIHDVPVIIFHHVPVPTDTWPPVSQVPASRGYEPSLKSHPSSTVTDRPKGFFIFGADFLSSWAKGLPDHQANGLALQCQQIYIPTS